MSKKIHNTTNGCPIGDRPASIRASLADKVTCSHCLTRMADAVMGNQRKERILTRCFEHDYFDEPSNSNALEVELQRFSEDGWELVSAVVLSGCIRHYFKRPVRS